MRFAVFADVHGNALALEAVLADMEKQSISQMVHLGDVFSGPLDAAATARLLQNKNIPTVLGNHDRYLIEQDRDQMGPSDQVAFDALPDEALSWLRTLPSTLMLWDKVFACHATPGDDSRYWMHTVLPDGAIIKASLAQIESLCDDQAQKAELILCAHTHIPGMVRLSNGTVLLNPGSVGCPAYTDVTPYPHRMQTGTPNASYAIAHRGADHENGVWDVTFRSVPYDHGQAARQARFHGREDWASGLETGWLAT